MRREDVSQELSGLAFEFFFWFSRFEFTLKENGFLKSRVNGARAEPGWDEFVHQWHPSFVMSDEALRLLAEPPDRQIIQNNQVEWGPVGLADCTSDLARVIRLVKTTRNNLFHGGKHGSAGWDNPKRASQLLNDGKAILDQLADLAGFQADYRRYY
jgi:hypothetical protein